MATSSSVPVSVVDVRIVRMAMPERLVSVCMGVRLTGRRRRFVDVPVVFVVLMPMLVLHALVNMHVLVPLADVEPDADHHERCCHSSRSVIGSPSTTTPITAPTNGAVEKYALVRPAPRPRSARTNSTRLTP